MPRLSMVIEGKGSVNDTKVTDGHLVLFDDGDEITLKSGDESLRFLLCSGKPINEPIAWRGPIVMNSEDELELAFSELQSQTFIKGND